MWNHHYEEYLKAKEIRHPATRRVRQSWVMDYPIDEEIRPIIINKAEHATAKRIFPHKSLQICHDHYIQACRACGHIFPIHMMRHLRIYEMEEIRTVKIAALEELPLFIGQLQSPGGQSLLEYRLKMMK